MRIASAALLLAFLSCCYWPSSNAYNANSLTLSGKRKPFVSREPPVMLQNYKRPKRQLTPTLLEFQDFLTKSKMQCGKEMGFTEEELQKFLLYEERPTPKEKCLMECVLKKMDIMDNNNQLSTAAIGRIADIISNNNPLIISIATASAENCKRFIVAQDSCEAAHQINKCIGNEIRLRRIKLIY